MQERKAGETEQEAGLRLTILKKTLELMTAAFALVAALAWNDAIQGLFLWIFGPQSNVAAKFVYAVAVTGLIVWIGFKLARVNRIVERRYGPKKET
ncbi:DUF5654 family protein [Candidatus Uhrbacteria bacterium]|nr:DUF5654 family protein [Candidatus Uhrbacteria bacterium]